MQRNHLACNDAIHTINDGPTFTRPIQHEHFGVRTSAGKPSSVSFSELAEMTWILPTCRGTCLMNNTRVPLTVKTFPPLSNEILLLNCLHYIKYYVVP